MNEEEIISKAMGLLAKKNLSRMTPEELKTHMAKMREAKKKKKLSTV